MTWLIAQGRARRTGIRRDEGDSKQLVGFTSLELHHLVTGVMIVLDGPWWGDTSYGWSTPVT